MPLVRIPTLQPNAPRDEKFPSLLPLSETRAIRAGANIPNPIPLKARKIIKPNLSGIIIPINAMDPTPNPAIINIFLALYKSDSLPIMIPDANAIIP